MRRNPYTPRAVISLWRSLSRVALLGAFTGCAPDPVAELAAALESAPGVAPRLSIPSAFRACSERIPEGGSIPRADCPALRPPHPDRLAPLAAIAAESAGDPAASYALALVDLVVDDGRGKALDRSISSLRKAVESTDRPAPALADLAAALVVRAERTQAPRDLLDAYETAEQALEREPGNPAALFNRALALDRFGLVHETARAWQAYLVVDSTSRWASEARQRLERALAVAPASRPPAMYAPPAAYGRYAAEDPQGARELGMDLLLADWGAAVEAGDRRRAEDRLRRAAALGEVLARRPGGDASLADAVRFIRAAGGDRGTTRALARAHREYGAGAAHFDDADYAGAEPRYAAAAAGPSPVLRGWARVYVGTTRVLNGGREEGERILRKTAAEADPTRHPALAARARWSLGSTLNRAERYERGLEEGRESARLFTRAGERINAGAALHVMVDSRFVLGEPDSGYATLHRALDRLKPYRASVRLHNLLVAGARIAAEDGLPRSAIRIQDEGVRVATGMGRPFYAAEAHLARARLLAGLGMSRRAEADVKAARPLIQAIRHEDLRDRFVADLHVAEAFASLGRDPERATRALDSAAAYFASRVPFRALPAVVAAAEARLAAGDAAGAVQRLEAAVRLLDQRRASVRVEPRRAAVFDAARSVVDRLVMLKLAGGHTAEALDYMDRGRASLAPAGPASSPGEDAEPRAPAGETVLEYALVADTLLAWTVTGHRVEVFRTAIDTARLVRTVRGLDARLEARAGEAEVRPGLAALYDQLIRPLEERLGGAGTPLVVIADGALASVPFAALYDGRRGRYLVEEHPLRFAVSLREAGRKPAVEPAGSVLLVADPAFDPREHPLLDRLAHAREEVRGISAGYPGAVLLEGPGATRPALEAALARAGTVHFAGHAVFDDARPERSYLVLAPVPGRETSGKMTAAELAGLDLRRVRLVVLAACRTVRSGRTRASGFTGLSGALLAAGAGAAVGSTWDVDDHLTAVLMREFHRAYRGSGDGPRALREAQLVLLRSHDPMLRTPAAWAGFRYAGR